MENITVYEEWDSIIVPSSHNPNVHYRIFYGTVNWTREPNDLRKAYVILLQNGNTKDWNVAKNNKEIDFRLPAHILIEDLDTVLSSLDQLKNRNSS